jgi:hypothetical protein
MNDMRDSRGVPISSGVPMIVRVMAVIGLCVIFTMLGIVITASKFGHAWPTSTAVQIPL